ncbi:MAG: hypothetical protein KF819_31705 [Labilithrix sp.]|nr:hypothetical protein [Labilithrix sp.]
MTRRVRWLSLFSLVLSSCAAAYGCGAAADDDPLGSNPQDDAASDGTVTLPDGAPIPGDGSTLPDGAPKPDADSPGEAGLDGGDDADAEIDAGYDAGVVDPPGPLSPTYVDYDINHVLVTGQSNAVATGSSIPLSTTQPYGNLMFNSGIMAASNCNGTGCRAYTAPTSFVPLVQNDNFYGGGAAETCTSGLANEISHLAFQRYDFNAHEGYPTKHDVLVSLHGRSGNTYWCLRKGFCSYQINQPATPPRYISPFAQGLMEVTDAKAVADAAGKSYVVRGVAVIHGESDHYAYINNAGNHPEFPLPGTDGTANKIQDYTDALVEWQEDYEASIKAITGQAQPVPLFVLGLAGGNTSTTSQVAQMTLAAHTRAPGKVIYVAPSYPLAILSDCLHYSSHGERHAGEYFAKVYAKVVFGGEAWEPVRPMQITRAGNVVTVKYHVPVPPLTFDTAKVTNPGNFGYTFVDNGALVAISSVAIAGPDTVTITLAAAPSGVNMRLRYAQNTPPSPACIGPGTTFSGGSRGNLRDSDATPSLYGYDLSNWGAPFEMPVP